MGHRRHAFLMKTASQPKKPGCDWLYINQQWRACDMIAFWLSWGSWCEPVSLVPQGLVDAVAQRREFRAGEQSLKPDLLLGAPCGGHETDEPQAVAMGRAGDVDREFVGRRGLDE